MSKKFKKNLKALLEVNDRNLFKGLKICKLETYPGQIPEVFQIKKIKLKLLTLESTFVRIIIPAVLVLG